MTLQRLKAIVLEAGADDVGVVEIDRPSLQDQKEAILQAFPTSKNPGKFYLSDERGTDPINRQILGGWRVHSLRRGNAAYFPYSRQNVEG